MRSPREAAPILCPCEGGGRWGGAPPRLWKRRGARTSGDADDEDAFDPDDYPEFEVEEV